MLPTVIFVLSRGLKHLDKVLMPAEPRINLRHEAKISLLLSRSISSNNIYRWSTTWISS